ncbi:MAG: hypothetical protein U5Q44_12190 [Dehalococcoidia bacterium]|nr:hypothetical protein [Dehalococcoidia bacterium]
MFGVWPAVWAPVRGLYFGWWVALASSAVAVFSWGLAFYGLGVYLPFLEDAHGWSAAGISGAFTVYHLAGVVTMLVIGPIIDERGAGAVMLAGAVLMAAGRRWSAS